MRDSGHKGRKRFDARLGALAVAVVALVAANATGFELQVLDPQGNHVTGFRWLLEEDRTLWVNPGDPVTDSIGVNIHTSYMPVVGSGDSAGWTATVAVPDPAKRYFVSVLPSSAGTMTGFDQGGSPVPPNAATVKVVVNPLPLPTSQISVFVFEDNNSISNAADLGIETGLANFKVTVSEAIAGGLTAQDAFGNAIGTEYLRNPDGSFQLDGEGNPGPDPAHIGAGYVLSGPDGWAYVKYLYPAKYGVLVTPPTTDPQGNPISWVQTATIEGTKVIDAWGKANEPRLFVEGFGTASAHVLFGFVNPAGLPWVGSGPGGATITGRVVNNHFSAPPTTQGYYSGEPVPECWVGLNSLAGEGLIALPCNPDSSFSIPGVPSGTYELVTWDTPLDQLFGFNNVTVPQGAGTVSLGDVVTFRWFGTFEGKVFNDVDEDGFPDPGEDGLASQTLNLRFRDGRVYQSAVTQPDGTYSFSEVFPFFKWLIAEVGFGTRKATGATIAVDAGGEVLPDNGWVYPSHDKLTPQEQAETNPHTGNNFSRTETGPVLLEAMQLFLNQTNVIDWGKAHYAEGENGGITGIVWNTVTRAENDPRFTVGESWEEGIPRVQVALYEDNTGPLGVSDGVIDDIVAPVGAELADVDNYPLGWADGSEPKGSEDVDYNSNGIWDPGDALQVVWTDSFDDNQPTGCIQHIPDIHGVPARDCFDNFATWNQVRPGVFDGGYAFWSYYPGGIASGSSERQGLPTGVYIVETAPPPFFHHQREEDKNVDFGNTYTPSLKSSQGGEPELLPPPCVGDLHVVDPYLALFPDQEVPAPFAGQARPLCDRKQVTVLSGQNAAADFFVVTEVPKAAQVVGFVLNDLTAEFNLNTPGFGEKAAPSWLPISFQDWQGHEITRVYCDEFGTYNALLPSNYSANVPSPSGFAPNMISIYLNHPFMTDPGTGQLVPDPYFDPDFSQSVWTFHYTPGATTYLDTPILPVAAFVGYPNRNLDVQPPTLTPGIARVDGDLAHGGPAVCAVGATITITATGLKQVPNPAFNPDLPGSPALITRNYGFGNVEGRVTLGGVDLPVTSWSDSTIEAAVPSGRATGLLLVQRGDNLVWSEEGITLHVGACGALFVPSDYPTIQAAVDAAAPGSLIVVEPGTYSENPIMWKPVRLQGSGAESTHIFATPIPTDRLQTWHDTVLAIRGNDPFAANEAPGVMVFGDAGSPFVGFPSSVDGFDISGSISGSGIYVYNEAHGLEISNNVIRSNQGSWGGGITVGIFDVATTNLNVNVNHNRIVKNGGVQGGGGVTLYDGSHGYRITDNFISGNLSREYGAGIDHYGLSDYGLIARNRILFNEVMFGNQTGGDGGGIFIGGFPGGGALSVGSGSVTVDSNRIIGNLAGAGRGGGIRLAEVNGVDVASLPQSQWYEIRVVNNIIANNEAAHSGGAISMMDVAKGFVVNNTMVNNDSLATAASAFPPGLLTLSDAQIAGVASQEHSTQLQAAFPGGQYQAYSDPDLANNIIWQNRSYYWDGSLNSNKGGLAPRAAGLYWDLGVESVDPSHVLHPMSSVLTSTAGYDPSNTQADPLLPATHVNNLATAVVLDEGGNRISVRFTPITVGSDEYLLDPLQLASSAVNLGDGSWIATLAELEHDIQGEVRCSGTMEAGADEIVDPSLAGDVNCSCVVNGLDVNQVVKVIFGAATVCNREDVNLDGVVNAADLAAVVNLAW